MCGGDRKLTRLVETRIEERSFAVHFQVRNERVPVRHRSPAGPRMEVHAGQAERRRNQRRGRLTVSTERLAVQDQLSIEAAGAPAPQHLPNGRIVDTEELGERTEV